ncbi:Uncharacterized protein FWK35_00011645 [Aphis craccivora]|uniref:Uncharacterized protein n=1 Tax=Aphis craccivora TaxID=307492 RepID=A0A6G0ZB07_APHCR|nr:Uncharacterized protein FWK35_00011645 [Aphis craccivora]
MTLMLHRETRLRCRGPVTVRIPEIQIARVRKGAIISSELFTKSKECLCIRLLAATANFLWTSDETRSAPKNGALGRSYTTPSAGRLDGFPYHRMRARPILRGTQQYIETAAAAAVLAAETTRRSDAPTVISNNTKIVRENIRLEVPLVDGGDLQRGSTAIAFEDLAPSLDVRSW